MTIPTTLLRKTKPDLIAHDSRGIKIEHGLRIAYNQSGNIVIGTILSFTCDWTKIRIGADNMDWWNCKFTMNVMSEDKLTPSTLKNPNSFVIL